MSRGYPVNPVVEHAAAIELAAALQAWQDAENAAKHTARHWLGRGARSTPIAEQLGMSRSTFYRWLAS